MPRSPSPSRRKLTSTPLPRPDDTLANHNKPFLVRHKDEGLLENRDFSSFTRPKPRRSKSPTRRPRSSSPSRLGMSSVQPLPGTFRNWFVIKIYSPITPMSDQDKISPYNINTISSMQVMKIKKNNSKGIIHWSNTKFSELTSPELYGKQ